MTRCGTCWVVLNPGEPVGAHAQTSSWHAEIAAFDWPDTVDAAESHYSACNPESNESSDAGPLGSAHSPRATAREAGDCGGSVEDPSTHLIHGPASDSSDL